MTNTERDEILAKFRCQFVQFTARYSDKILNGIDCDLCRIRKNIRRLRNYIHILESIPDCVVNGTTIDNIISKFNDISSDLEICC